MPKLRVAILEMKFQRLSNGLQRLQQRLHCEARHTIQACFHHPSEALVKATVFLNS